MKKRSVNKFVCIGLAIHVLSLPSCSISRNRKQEVSKHEKDSVSAIRTDHIFRKAGSSDRGQLSATLRQVTFSTPDSLGRQYPLSVTTTTLREQSLRSTADTILISSDRQSTQTGEATYATRQSIELKRYPTPWWLWTALILAIIAVIKYPFSRNTYKKLF
ncbi:hypothetical protein [uncultured Parabacteroides sp.]|uniref:hypothetical protein n=1 Tax=uncultured Parabacteroides sp. TaxID=512312 RepID=UPI00262D72F4|nr:hypothetical protein [uncultured Parabacteroides sp.]